ncbi:MAG: hypothetical protein ACREPM_11135 [Gemmatimonadaceae bacterium]
MATALADARRQTHHAAQFATAAGISYLPHEADDSHTNLEWISSLGALASHVMRATHPFRIGVRVADLTLLVLDGGSTVMSSMPLDGETIASATAWLRARLTESGTDGRRYTLTRHYSIPRHPVADGAAFDASDRAKFGQLSRWFACAAEELGSVRAANAASDVRCWPHHFDIGTLIDAGDGKSIGVGLEPGDVYYDEPYFYVNMHPQPKADALSAVLEGKGIWHTHEWIGAVLPGSRVLAGDGQRTQIDAFIRSAVGAARRLIG